jgi:hypothetical protein
MTGTNGSTNVTRLSLEQIESALSELALNGTGNEKIRALALLRKDQPATTVGVVPAPLNDAEKVDFLAMLLGSVGPFVHRLATSKAFGRRQPSELKLKASLEQLPIEIREKIKRITSVAVLYRTVPELKKPGRPHGFPVSGGPMAKRQFVQNLATEFYLEQLNGVVAPSDVSDRDPKYRQALEDLRATIGSGDHGAPWLRSTRGVLEPLLAAVDNLLADPAAPYPPAPKKTNGSAPSELAPAGPAAG